MDAKLSSLTSDLKQNFVTDDRLSRAYSIHEKDLYNLALLALKGVQIQKQSSNLQDTQKEAQKPSENSENHKNTMEGPLSLDGSGKESHSEPETNIKSELKKILKSDFYSIEAKEFLIHDLMKKIQKESNLTKEREITKKQPTFIKRRNLIGAGKSRKEEKPKKSPVSESVKTDCPSIQTIFSEKLNRAIANTEALCDLTEEQLRHLKKITRRVKDYFSLTRNNRLFTRDMKFFFQDNHVVNGAVRFFLPKLLAVLSIDRNSLFEYQYQSG